MLRTFRSSTDGSREQWFIKDVHFSYSQIEVNHQMYFGVSQIRGIEMVCKRKYMVQQMRIDASNSITGSVIRCNRGSIQNMGYACFAVLTTNRCIMSVLLRFSNTPKHEQIRALGIQRLS